MWLLANKHFSPYKVYISRANKLVVCLNPKVGSTTFREVLLEGLQHIGARPFRSRLWPMNITRRYSVAPLKDYINAFAHPNCYSFHCFVRNPYSRVLSAWNDKLVKGFNGGQYPRSMIKLVPRLRQFATHNQLEGEDESKPIPFSTFIAYVESQTEGKRNQHWDSQFSVLSMEKINYDHIYKMETEFVEGMVNILAPLGIPKEWIINKLKRPANASGKIEQPVYNRELANRVYQLYQQDFKTFGYAKDSWQGS